MRILLRDPWSGGVLAALTAFLVLTQVFLSALSCGSTAMAAPGDGGFAVICHGAGGTSPAPSGHDGKGSPEGDCPCAIACGMGGAIALGPKPLDLGAAYSRADGVDLRYAPAPAPADHPRLAGAPAFPTGPPTLAA